MPLPYEQTRFVGFVDVLGYKEIAIRGQFTDAQRFRYLHSVFENLAAAAHQIKEDLGGPPLIRAVQFSDSFYFSSSSAVAIVTAMSEFFASVFTYYDRVFEGPGPADDPNAFPEWMPFLRGAIVHGWLFEGRDITLPELREPAEAFRNPIGPAVGKAYLLGEESGLEGMRLATTSTVRSRFEEELPTVPPHSELGIAAAPLHPIYLKADPDNGDIYEIPWFESRLQADNTVGTFDILVAAERQFAPPAMKHYRGTWDAILRTPGVQNNASLQTRAWSIRHGVVERMAYASWEKRGRRDGDSWRDWFLAEGIIRPEECCATE